MLAALFIPRAVSDPTAEQAALLKTFREEFVAVTPGEGKFPKSFEMGEGAATRDVALTRSFSIAKYEVPQNLWEAVMGKQPQPMERAAELGGNAHFRGSRGLLRARRPS